MQSPSLFLRTSRTLFTFFTFMCYALAATTSATANYAIQTTYSGSNFFSGFTFFTDPDPTHGFVTYVNQSQAQSMKLISATDGSPVYIGVDYTNKYNGTAAYSGINGVGRPSVRITSNQIYNHGLFIADIANMPGGVCGAWPAFWSLGTGTWPQNGEIDIIEGVNTQTQTLTSLHSAGRCNVPSYPSTETGTIQTTNCTYDSATGNNAAGCGVLDGDTASFGAPFNSNGGGVFALQWTGSAIRSWFFRRNSIPSDITNGAPQPSGWGTPYVNFQGDCSIDSNFKNHQLVLDTTFCGDWAGSVWGDSCASSTGVSSCSVYVGNNPSAFKNMYWSINSIKVYSNESIASTTTTTSSKTTTSSTTIVSSSTTTTTPVPSTTTTTTTTTPISSTTTPSTTTPSTTTPSTTTPSTTTPSTTTPSTTTPVSSTTAVSTSTTTASSSATTTSSKVTSTSTPSVVYVTRSSRTTSTSSLSSTPTPSTTPSTTGPSTTPSATSSRLLSTTASSSSSATPSAVKNRVRGVRWG